MPNHYSSNTAVTLWQREEKLLLKDGALKGLWVALITYCLSGTLSLYYYDTVMQVSAFLIIGILTPLILIASAVVSYTSNKPLILAHGIMFGLITCNAVLTSVSLDVEALGPIILANIPVFVVPAMVMLWKPLNTIICLIYALIINILLFNTISIFKAGDIIQWWPISVAISIGTYFLVRFRYNQTKSNFLLNYNLTLKQSELQEEINTKNKLFSIIAHDLRTPIGNINSLLQYASDFSNKDDKENLETFLNAAKESSENSYELLDNLLKWSQTQLNAISVQITEVNVLQKVQKVIRLFTNQIEQKNIHLDIDINPNATLETDKAILQTVFRNILSNAIKFTPQHKAIFISYRNKTLTISDEGIGIEPDQLQNLFNSNFNKSTSGTNGEQGTGLGLILANELMQQMEGKIDVESTRGKGTSFTMVFK